MGRPTPAHRLPAITSTHPERRRCRPTCQPDSSPRRTLTPPTSPHAWNRLRTTLRFVAAIPCTPPAHHRTSLLWSPSSDFLPSQPHQLPANTIHSPYIHRASGFLQIAVSTLLRTGSIETPELLFAEHCRYGTRDFATIEICNRNRIELMCHVSGVNLVVHPYKIFSSASLSNICFPADVGGGWPNGRGIDESLPPSASSSFPSFPLPP